MSNYLARKYDLTVEIGGHRYPCTEVGLNYGLNMVPTARCGIASGREIASGVLSRIHQGWDAQGDLPSARVIFRATGKYDAEHDWPDQEVVLFDGYAVGVGYSKNQGQVRPEVRLSHWLSDLDFASALSANTHLQSISQYTYPAALRPRWAGQTAIPSLSIAAFQFGGMIQSATITEDLWGQVFKPVLGELASQEPLKLSGTINQCFSGDFKNHELIERALQRIEGMTGTGSPLDRPLSPYTPKLSFDNTPFGQLEGQLVDAIQEFISHTAIHSLSGQTIWNLLISHYASNLLFGIVPQPEKAFMIPVNPCFREYGKVIAANDYNVVQMQMNRERPLRGVGLRCGTFWSTAVNNAGDASATADVGIGGCFAPPQLASLKGLVKVVRAPLWIEKLGSAGYNAGATSGATNHNTIGTATTPVSNPDASRNGHPAKAKKSDSFKSASEIAGAYAQYLYLLESLRGRSATVSGKLRFDIAPGSMVRIQAASHHQGTSLTDDVVGCVAGLSIGLNAESGQAGTGFQISYPRTIRENQTELMSMPYHPIYNTNFTAAPLVDQLAFD